jgi:ubiquinone/menaquinone biosynthesis C-methylase UbiE
VSNDRSMRKDLLPFLCCPLCHGSLRLTAQDTSNDVVSTGLLECDLCNRAYSIRNGIADFLLPETLNEQDKKWMLAYDRMALSYDIIMSYLSPLFSIGLEPFERYSWVKRLRIGKGANVLDISTGTGRNLSFINSRIGSQGKLAAMDISNGMLVHTKMKIERKKWRNVELYRANASYLPYKEDSFDAVMHVGGVNTFGDKRKALNEMVRVAKPNSKIVIVDEGLSSERQGTFFGKFLIKTNALYKSKPPTSLLPKNMKHLRISWNIIYSAVVNTSWPFYIAEFEKA